MSKVVKCLEDRELSNIVECNNKFYYVDSCYTFDNGFESMVFPCVYDAKFCDYKVVDWKDIYTEWYVEEKEMEKRHYELCTELERFI